MLAANVALLLSLLVASAAGQCDKKSLPDMTWHNASALGIRGKAFNNSVTRGLYERLPAAAEPSSKGPKSTKVVRSAVWELSTQPAGMFIQFSTDASCIFVKYNLRSASTSMWHFPSTGMAGMDLYSWDTGNATWRWAGTSHPCSSEKCGFPLTASKMASLSCGSSADANAACETRVYRLHLPTYAAITDDLEIGTNKESTVLAPDSTHLGAAKPIVWYGTSILQGGVASRPGQVNTHIVSRALETEIYNFGFSGNGVMELNVAQYLATVDCSMIIVDCNPNMDGPTITSRAIPLVHYLRSHGHATTPIVLSEGTPYGTDWAQDPTTPHGGNRPKNVALAAAFKTLVDGGDKQLFYAHSTDIFAPTLGLDAVDDSLVDPTVGGTHLTDLGMRKQAAFWAQKIPSIKAESLARWRGERGDLAGAGDDDDAAAAAIGGRVAEPTQDDLQREREETEALRARARREQWEGWGDIEHAPAPAARMQLPSLSEEAPSAAAPVDAAQFVRGRPFPSEKRNHSYDRFPLSYAASLRPDVWQLSEMSTGSYLRFTSDSSHISFKWALRPACAEKWFAGCHLFHMPDSGTNAFDTYIWDSSASSSAGGWRHYPNSLLHYSESGTGALIQPDAFRGKNSTWLVYLPLRNAPDTISLTPTTPGTICGAGCAADKAPEFAMPPVVWYGTSIQQGGVASRAGNTYDAVISRTLQREVLNLGFANNGVMELSVGKLLSDIKDAAVIVIDCLPNMNTAQVSNRTIPLVQYLRANGHPTTPIVLAEGTPTPADWLNDDSNGTWANPKNAALREQYNKLLAGGGAASKHLHYVSANDLFDFDLKDGSGAEGRDVNPTVCGIHSSDLGQYMIANFYAKFLPPVIASSGKLKA